MWRLERNQNYPKLQGARHWPLPASNWWGSLFFFGLRPDPLPPTLGSGSTSHYPLGLCSIICWSAGVKIWHMSIERMYWFNKSWCMESWGILQQAGKDLRDILSTLYWLSVCDKADFKNDYVRLSKAWKRKAIADGGHLCASPLLIAPCRQIQDLLVEKKGTAIGGVQAVNLDEKRCQQAYWYSRHPHNPCLP